jgi:hypothetical protein
MNSSWKKVSCYVLAAIAASVLSGCKGFVNSQILTVQDEEPGPEEGAHLQQGQKIGFIGPLNNGEHYIVVAISDPMAPAHRWKIEPYVATRQPSGAYVLQPIVPGFGHAPDQEGHLVDMEVVRQEPLEVRMRGRQHPNGGPQHGGVAHMME